jgi:hypothetical protein
MSSKRILTVVKQLVIVASIMGAAGTASAQSAFKGKFTLPYEVRWGQAVLAPGEYTITMESTSRPALVTRLTGGAAFVMAVGIESASKDRPTALLITKTENERVVRSLNWPEGGKTFVYKPFTKAERRLYGTASLSEALPILTAQK